MTISYIEKVVGTLFCVKLRIDLRERGERRRFIENLRERHPQAMPSMNRNDFMYAFPKFRLFPCKSAGFTDASRCRIAARLISIAQSLEETT